MTKEQKEAIEMKEMRISPVTTVQLEKILNYLVDHKGYGAKFGNILIGYQGIYEDENKSKEMFIIYRDKEE